MVKRFHHIRREGVTRTLRVRDGHVCLPVVPVRTSNTVVRKGQHRKQTYGPRTGGVRRAMGTQLRQNREVTVRIFRVLSLLWRDQKGFIGAHPDAGC